MKDDFFPFFLNIKDKSILVIGAGEIAFRKVKTIHKYGGIISIISKEKIHEDFIPYIANFTIDELLEKNLNSKLDSLNLRSYFMVLACTNDEILNSRVAAYCDNRNILVNNITSKEDMNCRFCKVIESDDARVGVSGLGNPKIAIKIAEKIKEILR